MRRPVSMTQCSFVAPRNELSRREFGLSYESAKNPAPESAFGVRIRRPTSLLPSESVCNTAVFRKVKNPAPPTFTWDNERLSLLSTTIIGSVVFQVGLGVRDKTFFKHRSSYWAFSRGEFGKRRRLRPGAAMATMLMATARTIMAAT
jgi:hypothetical protein